MKLKMTIIMMAIVFSFVSKDAFAKDNHPDPAAYQRLIKMYRSYQKKFPDVPEITAEQASLLASDNHILFVDVRTTEEQNISMIPNAITSSVFEQNPDKYKNKQIIAYCTIGYRSGKFCRKFRKKGFHVKNLIGGILGWAFEQKPLLSNNQPTTTIHVYGRKWDLTPQSHSPTW